LSASDESARRKLLKLAGAFPAGSMAVTATTVGQQAGKYLQDIIAAAEDTSAMQEVTEPYYA
jgi:hypothetical protein